ncbi:hypothetical protein [Acetobacter thailandicus]|nr:hypothetical protein [Acetobacter thailandicus]
MDSSLKAFLESQISELEQRIESVITKEEDRSATSCSRQDWLLPAIIQF